ncbi:MAG: serine/threonine-protein kinase [Gemmataceae bacterium]
MPDSHDDRLDAAIAEYLDAERRGEPPSLPAFLDRHADVRHALAAFLADHTRFRREADPIDPLTVDFAEPAAGPLPHVRYFGDYELLEELARGGFGVVYKARQVSLDRTVALKMLHRAGRASAVDVARFRIEAEAAASLDHPNIVPIYEVGEHDGRPYYAMKFIDGPTLGRTPRGSWKVEASRLADVSRAVHYAHQRGILHRDLKPGNILLASGGGHAPGDRPGRPHPPLADAIPYVADFGLAKQLDAGASLTESNALLGTAGYVSPEQARGSKGLTTATDIFSLGVILYERLTGAPAFPGATILERLDALRTAATPRPTQLVPTLPRDLETVCLKCLEREPAKRYPTAEALADDLARWVRGEPIAARRTGPMERFALWCRRNPVVAGLSGGLALSLVTLTSVSLYFAGQARREAADAVIARNEVAAARDQAERTLVRTYLRPLGYNTGRLNDAERHSLSELAQLSDDRLRLMCLAEALATPDVATRFARRSDEIVQAVVGVSDRRRQLALALASRAQRDDAASLQSRLAALCLTLRLGGTDLSIVDWSDKWEDKIMAFSVPVNDLTAETADQLWPAWQKLLETNDAAAIRWACEGVTSVVPRLDPAAAASRADALIRALGKTRDGTAIGAAGDGLAAVAGRLDPAAAAVRADALIRSLETLERSEIRINPITRVGTTVYRLDPNARQAAWNALAAVADRVEPAAAASRVDALIGVLGKTTDEAALLAAKAGLWAMADRLDPAAAASRVNTLIHTWDTTSHFAVRNAADVGLAAVAHRLDPPALARCCDALIDQIERAKNGNNHWAFNAGLAAFGRLDPAAERDRLGRATDALVSVLLTTKGKDRFVLPKACDGLAITADRLDPAAERDRLGRVADALISVLRTETDRDALQAASAALVAVTGRLDPAAVASCTDALIGVLEARQESSVLRATCDGLAAAAGRLDPTTESIRLRQAADVLVIVLRTTTDQHARLAACAALATAVGRLDPAVERERQGRATDILIEVLKTARDADARGSAKAGLAIVAARLDSSAASIRADVLIGVLKSATERDSLRAAGGGLVALAGQLDPTNAHRFLLRAMGVIVSRFDQSRDADDTTGLIEAATQILPGLPAEEADCYGLAVLQRTKQWNHGTPEDVALVNLIVSAALHRVESVVAVLRDLRCTGRTRAAAVLRLEQLAFAPTGPDLQRTVADSALVCLVEPAAAGVLAAGRAAAWEANRKFRTIWDAAAWLRTHHPEIDLDAPYKSPPR